MDQLYILKLIIQKASELISYNESTYWNNIYLFFFIKRFSKFLNNSTLELAVACNQRFVLENILYKDVRKEVLHCFLKVFIVLMCCLGAHFDSFYFWSEYMTHLSGVLGDVSGDISRGRRGEEVSSQTGSGRTWPCVNRWSVFLLNSWWNKRKD